MTTVQNPAVEKLYKKFAALRATLPTEEREIFDQVIPAEEEVTAHGLKRRGMRAAQRIAKKSPEAAAHALKKGATRGAQRIAKKSPEVAAHALKKGATRGAQRIAKKSPEGASR